MAIKVLMTAAVAVVLAITGYGLSGGASSCCVPGAGCCEASLPCCAAGPCCYPGADCCEQALPCCEAKACCAGAAECGVSAPALPVQAKACRSAK